MYVHVHTHTQSALPALPTGVQLIGNTIFNITQKGSFPAHPHSSTGVEGNAAFFFFFFTLEEQSGFDPCLSTVVLGTKNRERKIIWFFLGYLLSSRHITFSRSWWARCILWSMSYPPKDIARIFVGGENIRFVLIIGGSCLPGLTAVSTPVLDSGLTQCCGRMIQGHWF